MKSGLGISMTLMGLIFLSPAAFAGTVLEDGIKYGIHAGSHGTYLRRIEADIAKMRAEFSLRKTEFSRDLTIATREHKRKLWEERETELRAQVVTCEAREPKLFSLGEAMESVLNRCGDWLKRARERKIQFQEIVDELEEEIAFKNRFAEELPHGQLRDALENLRAGLERVAQREPNPGLDVETIGALCSRQSDDVATIATWLEETRLLCQRLRIQADYVAEKRKGLE